MLTATQVEFSEDDFFLRLSERITPRMRELAEQIVSRMNGPVDIEQWAATLAADVGKATD